LASASFSSRWALVTAIRSSLIGRLQIPLAPAWVWLGFGEVPKFATCVDGLVVVAAIVSEAAIKNDRTVRPSGSCEATEESVNGLKAGIVRPGSKATPQNHSASSGHGTMVDFTVFIAIASATARPMPSSVKG